MERVLQKDSQIISLLRFPLTFLVVMQHCRGEIDMSPLWNRCTLTDLHAAVKVFFSGGLSLIAVPAFFFISGYLFFRNVSHWNKETYTGKLKKRIHSLLIPYLLWNILCIPLVCFSTYFEHLAQAPSLAVQEYLGSIRWLHIFWDHTVATLDIPNLLGSHTLYVAPLLGTMWYVRDLIIMVVLSPLVWLFIKKTGKYGMVAFTLLFLLRIWPPITLNGISAYFFTLGAWFSLSRKSLIIPTIWRIPIFSIAALCLGWFVVSGGNEQYIGWQLTPLFLLTGVLTTFYLADSLVSHQPQIKMPAILSDSSFFVYALHIEFALPIGFFISKMVTLHATHPLVMTIRYLLTPIIIYVLCVAVYAVMRRTVPRMLFLLTGNR